MKKNRYEKRPQPASKEVFFQNRSIFSFDVVYSSTIMCHSTCRNDDLSLVDAGVGWHGRV